MLLLRRHSHHRTVQRKGLYGRKPAQVHPCWSVFAAYANCNPVVSLAPSA